MTVDVSREQWNDHEALRLSNGVLEVVTLPGGGHLAELRLASGGNAGINCLWTRTWPTADPGTPRAAFLTEQYGADSAARFLASYTGHSLCLDLFGPPSQQEAAQGIALHGEAAVHPWSFEFTSTGCIGRADLPAAQLSFERRLSLASGSAVLLVEERIENRGGQPREVQWVQHLTLGPPLLAANESLISASLDRGLTWPLGYEGHEILRDNAPFAWPYAPALDGAAIDLRIPFAHPGTGFVAATRITPHRDFAFIAALNFRIGLALVYCFRRRDFPWITIWEENCARTGAPWKGTAQARGMEFGTTPMPVGRDALHDMGTLLDTPSTRNLLPRGTLNARYLAALANLPAGWRSITDVKYEQHELRLIGDDSGSSVVIPVNGLLDFFMGEIEK